MKKLNILIFCMLCHIVVYSSCSRADDTRIDNTQTVDNPINNKQMKITIGNNTFTATFANTVSAEALKKKLPLTLNMSDYGGFEKIATIDALPRADKKENSLSEGDIMLYSGNTLVLFYANHGGYSYTRIGKIDNPQGLKQALGTGNVTVKFELID